MKYIISGIIGIGLVVVLFILNDGIIKNIVLGIISAIAIVFLVSRRNEIGLNNMFNDKVDAKTKTTSIFSIKELFKKK